MRSSCSQCPYLQQNSMASALCLDLHTSPELAAGASNRQDLPQQ
jgi:hypothetical protein